MVDALIKISGSIFMSGLGLFLFGIGMVIVFLMYDEAKKRW
jgi:hypothetical protein